MSFSMQTNPLFSVSPKSPSFSSSHSSSVNLAKVAARVIEEFRRQDEESDDWLNRPEKSTSQDGNHEVSNGNSEDLEFAFDCGNSEPDSVVTADEIFHNGQIRPLYQFPLFNSVLLSHEQNSDSKRGVSAADLETATSRRHHRPALRKLMSEERESASVSSSSSEADDELNGVSPESYCVWAPHRANASDGSASSSPARCSKIKSNSTGSSKRCKLRQLLYLRSSSNGKETLFAKSKGAEEKYPPEEGGGDGYFSRNSSGRSAAGTAREGTGSKRRLYLPYRKDSMGIFVNVDGLTRNLPPFR